MVANIIKKGGLISTMKKLCALLIFVVLLNVSCASTLENEFRCPPRESGVRCWWWWLNGNVTREAITRDLNEMHSKGFSGAMIFDAGGADQRGNAQVPAGPTFASPEWVELYTHALKEAQRLDLKLGLSIQSGWNLGGPNVTPDFAAKQLTWSEVQVRGPIAYHQKLPLPSNRNDYYRDLCVLAYPEKNRPAQELRLKASSYQSDYLPEQVMDGDNATFWVSSGVEPGQGPTSDTPEWLEFSFDEPVTVCELEILGRKGYGPKNCRVQCLDSGDETALFQLKDELNKLSFSPVRGRDFRIFFEDAYDPKFPQIPRNVQVCRLVLFDEQGHPLGIKSSRKPIRDLRLKAGFQEIGMSAPDTRFLLDGNPSQKGEEDTCVADIQNISGKMGADGTLTWQVPEGNWTILRFGYTITDSHVSTYSADWKGLVIDYLSKEAFDRYWDEVVAPLLDKAGPLVGTVLTQLETDSWECGGMNWSPGFADDFRRYCGYDPIPFLPVIAGKIVESRDSSNAFLADLRKTLAHCVSENHYKVFAERAAQYGLGIQPESAGPHAGPMDGIKNYSHSDIMMSEFWVPSPHRPTPPQRFFVKQASSAAHIYGKQYVGAESFTSIGPHWNDVLWKSQKPSMDHEFCSGLNMVFFHTFTCSPKEMGLPGQEYFAGTHVNPQVTWWDYSDAFIDYINRVQSLTQQSKFVADVLYYYGDHVPNIFPLKESDPAGVLPGYDYDVTNEDVLLQLKVIDGKIIVPGGIPYRLLVLPDHKVLSLAVLEKVDSLLKQGAAVLGPKPERLVSLVGGKAAQKRFHELADQLWGDDPGKVGSNQIGKGRLIWGQTVHQFLQANGVALDFEDMGTEGRPDYDYIHYTLDGADFYFVCNQTEQPQAVECAFRVNGKLPELWSPIDGQVRTAAAFTQSANRTTIPLQFDPYGSLFILFRKPISPSQQGTAATNFPTYQVVQQIKGPWQVSFDPVWGGPKCVEFENLTDWTEHADPGIKYYSGSAVYSTTFTCSESAADVPYWLVLNDVRDVGIAAVQLNGQTVGTTWTKPFRVEITDALRPGENELEITVVNSWYNRLIGDRGKPQDQRYTKTNISIRNNWNLQESGLLGPVQILKEKAQ